MLYEVDTTEVVALTMNTFRKNTLTAFFVALMLVFTALMACYHQCIIILMTNKVIKSNTYVEEY